MKKSDLVFSLILVYSSFTPMINYAQTTENKHNYENVLNVQLGDFDGMKEGEKHKWTTNNGNTYGIKFEYGEKSTWIEYGGNM